MKKFYSTIIALLLFTSLYAQATFEIQAPNVVGRNERFIIKFVANSRIDSWEPPKISGASVLAGPTVSTMSNVQFINGKRTDAFEQAYTYVLLAGDQSVIAISNATATIDGKQYSTRHKTIEVVNDASSSGTNSSSSGSSNQSSSGGAYNINDDYDDNYYGTSYDDEITYGKADLFLRLHLSKTKVVQGEPIVATLKLYTRSGIAGFEDVKFPVFNGFWSQEIDVPQNITFSREKVGNQIYNSALLRRYVIIPQQSGSLKIDPADIVCQVQVMERPQRGRSIFDDLFGDNSYSIQRKRLTSGSQTINVSPLPSGAPASFGGAVGKFNMNAHFSRDSLLSNQASSLIIEISGSGNLNLIETPNISLPSDFEVYDTKVTNNFNNSLEGSSGKRIFEYPFIPRASGEYKIDPIEFTYYDISQRKYVTLKYDPSTVVVGKGSEDTQAQLNDYTNQRSVSNLGEDIRYIKTNHTSFNPKDNFLVAKWLYYLIYLLLILIFALIIYLLRRNIKLRSDITRVKNKRANKVAKLRLKQSQIYLKENKLQDFYSELSIALTGYIGDKLSIPVSDMQKSTIQQALESRGVAPEKASDFINLLNDCEMVRYAPSMVNNDMTSHFEKAVSMISYFEEVL